MSFVDPVYLLFLPVVVGAAWLLQGHHRLQNGALLLASLVFYGWIHPWLVLLLLGVSSLNYATALAVHAERERGGTGGRWLALSMIGSLGTLCFFKYFDFFEGPFSAAVSAVGLDPGTLRVFLPVGLSFYTFHAMSYTIDVWRGHFEARRDLLDYLLFVTFFPQLVAGPIHRGSQLYPQVERPRTIDLAGVTSGFSLAMFGAFKKVVLADTMAPYVNVIYAHDAPSAPMIWAAALGFTIQALADFSGYTDMARGSARMLGFELVENFNHPYLAAKPSEFWNRWHMSFSTWLRDYVYMPASFSPWVRRWLSVPGVDMSAPFWTTTRALTLTMLVSGLWHGSTWNYVLWGAYYAVIGTVWQEIEQRIPRKVRKQRDWRPLLVPLMFAHTVVGMMIFREPSAARLLSHFTSDPLGGTADQWIIAGGMLMMCLYGAVPLVLALLWEQRVAPRLQDSPWRLPLQTTAWATVAVLLLVFYRSTGNDFVYFQF
ncbi:MAG TPA: MBOAT family O-acyltransferase [Myxococcota bacterium]|nr:MBOAT family O-acyltransferase [Myxococcota bacterium]